MKMNKSFVNIISSLLVTCSRANTLCFSDNIPRNLLKAIKLYGPFKTLAEINHQIGTEGKLSSWDA